jgi:uncharacterized protein involved in exopolysaccharide biosynthesis/Mrp family chromosome partitioning ATPase
MNSRNHHGPGLRTLLGAVWRHKVPTALCITAALGAAAFVHYHRERLHESTARLLVRYVITRESTDAFEDHSSPGSAPGRTDAVMDTEIRILTSMDLALEVARHLGPQRIDPQSDPSHAEGAARTILARLAAETSPGSRVLELSLTGTDPALTRDILTELLERYFRKHLDIHRSAAAFDEVARQTQAARQRLESTERELHRQRTAAGIVSLGDATGALSLQRARTRQDMLAAKAELAALEAVTGQQGGAAGKSPRNPVPHAEAEYRSLTEMIEFLRKRDMELRVKFMPDNPLVLLNRNQLAEHENRLQALMRDDPSLASRANTADPSRDRGRDARAELAATASRIKVYESQLAEMSRQFTGQYAAGSRIDELERQRQMQEAEYRSLETSLRNARTDQTLDPSRMPNITIVQHPTEATPVRDKKTLKLVLGIAAAGPALGIAIACLLEALGKRRIGNAAEIENRLGLPLLMSIPILRLPPPRDARDSATPRIGGPPQSPRNITPATAGNPLSAYTDTIRDRLLLDFHVRNANHKPKLIGIASLSHGDGASTIAASLAESLAEPEGSKVLLVHLDAAPNGTGRMTLPSVTGALSLARLGSFHQNPRRLYRATAAHPASQRKLTALDWLRLLPRLQSSEYDFIVFDLPSLAPPSATLSLGALMDKLLLVVSAPDGSPEDLLQCHQRLSNGGADVTCILNKAG